MRSTMTILLAASALAALTDAAENALADRPLQVGGLVTLDNTNRLDSAGDPTLGLDQVALQANVSLSPGLAATVVLLAEGRLDMLSFDQALASYAPDGSAWSFLIGQQTFDHGLLTTRLISDPDLLPEVEVKAPGAGAAYAAGPWRGSLAVTVLETGEDGSRRDYALVPALDIGIGKPVQARVSALASRFRNDADLAVSATLGRWQADAEAFDRLGAWSDPGDASGLALGLAFSPTADWTVAARYDALFGGHFGGDASMGYHAGATVRFLGDLFAAAEYGYAREGGRGAQTLALQVGLESGLDLPGFQRKTLSQE